MRQCGPRWWQGLCQPLRTSARAPRKPSVQLVTAANLVPSMKNESPEVSVGEVLRWMGLRFLLG